MAWKRKHFNLADMMLIFGSFNILSVKLADTMTSESVETVQPSMAAGNRDVLCRDEVHGGPRVCEVQDKSAASDQCLSSPV